MRIGLIFGGRSVEHRVSVTSARAVGAALEAAGHGVHPLGVARDGSWIGPGDSAAALAGSVDALAGGEESPLASLRHLVAAPVDVLFPLIHGTWGEDGTLQGLCEMVDLPYVGAGVATSALAMDKLLAKRQLAAAGLPVAPFLGFAGRRFAAEPDAVLAEAAELGFPLFVKPASGGSSVGISRVPGAECLATAVEHALGFDDAVLLEREVEGRELECSVLGYGELEASAVGEIVPGHEFYDYADKYLEDTAGLHAPADLEPAKAVELRQLAVAAFAALGGWGMGRVDFFLAADGGAVVNEINTVPGFTEISMYPKLWEVSGRPLPELVDRLVALAVERHRDRRRLDEGIADWLEELAGR